MKETPPESVSCERLVSDPGAGADTALPITSSAPPACSLFGLHHQLLASLQGSPSYLWPDFRV